ncbi:MAG: succinylglutamate desuccinylase/aspartoacylase family protein [Nitrospirae bacterium]|nr:succinylglutamate desuccinylase/aspartoacylase family protein [Nitrospirota bacterium]
MFRIFIVISTLNLICATFVYSETQLLTYFKDTEYELNVYKIKGISPGPTLMIIGGIQGDEPGGYLSADLYADMALEKGSLIVVPRANLLSIIKHRRLINKDMNRQFSITAKQHSYEDKVVEILEELITESDYLLNLHEGSGFYSDHWENSMINPMRFGQSIIADTDQYKTKDGRTLRLGNIARTGAANVNNRIENSGHHFKFNNHRTFDNNTKHPEQRRSATYFALSYHDIPAFGIETSKEIHNIETKIKYQTMIINEFIKQLGLISPNPKITLERPALKYMIVSVNGADKIVRNSEILRVNIGDIISISKVEANYPRGLTVDILEKGNLSDLHKNFELTKPLMAIVRKDGVNCGQIKININDINGTGKKLPKEYKLKSIREDITI